MRFYIPLERKMMTSRRPFSAPTVHKWENQATILRSNSARIASVRIEECRSMNWMKAVILAALGTPNLLGQAQMAEQKSKVKIVAFDSFGGQINGGVNVKIEGNSDRQTKVMRSLTIQTRGDVDLPFG